VMAEQNQSLLAKLLTTLQIDIEGSLLTRSMHPLDSVKSNPELQAYKAIHSIETFDKRSIQHLQRSTMGQTTEADPTQSFIAWVWGVLLLPWLQGAPNHPLLGPLKILGGAHPTRLSQGVRPHPRGDFSIAKHTVLPRAECDCLIQNDQLTSLLSYI